MPKCCDSTWYPDRVDIEQDTSREDLPREDFSGTPFKSGVPGRIIDTSGDETFRGRTIEPTISQVYECRYFPGVLPTMRLKVTAGIYKDRVLNVKFVKIIRKQGSLPKQWLYCEEKAATS